MGWNDDSWKDGYDAWKLRSPYDDAPEEECFHEDFEINWEGRATCDRCGHAWWAAREDIKHCRAVSEEYDAFCRREDRKQWWRDQWERAARPWRWFWYRTFGRLGMPRRAVRCLNDDEIPF